MEGECGDRQRPTGTDQEPKRQSCWVAEGLSYMGRKRRKTQDLYHGLDLPQVSSVIKCQGRVIVCKGTKSETGAKNP